MRRLWLLLTIAVLGAMATLLVVWQRNQHTTVPMIPLVPAQPFPAAGPGAGPEAATTDPALAGRDRVDPPAPISDPDAALLVTVVRSASPAAPGLEMAPSSADAVADLEVEVLVDGPSPPEPLRGITGQDGTVRFDIPGGAGREVTVRCAIAAPVRTRLVADDVAHVTLRLVPRLSVRGSVVDAAGRGIAGADLVLLPFAGHDRIAGRLRRVGRSRTDGSFDLRLAAGGRLGAQHPAYSPSAMYVVQAQVDPTRPPVTTVLQLSLLAAPSTVQGRVVDAAGQPVPGAELEFRSLASPPAGAALAAPPQRARSAADGSFVVPHLRPGGIEFSARAEGHGGQRGRFDVAAGAAKQIEIRLPTACEVHGRVDDERGQPVAEVRVWSAAIDAFEGTFAVTGTDGTFRLRGLAPGTVALTAREGAALTAEPMARRAETRLELRAGQIGHWVATLRTPVDDGLLRGQVVDTDGARLPTWRVLVRSRDGTAQSQTDSGGFFHVRRPGQGLVDVLVYAPDTPPNAFAQAVRPAVEPDQGPVRIVVDRRTPWGSIVGRVQSRAGQALPATLTVRHHERQELARFQAGDDGTIRIDAVPPGTVDLRLDHPGHARTVRTNLAVAPNASIDVGTVLLDASAVLFGSVAGPNGEPPEQLQVTLLTAPERLVGEYTAGTYRFAAAPPGRHTLQVQGPTIAAATFPVDLQAGVERRQDMRLEAGVPRRVVVTAPAAAGRVVALALQLPGAVHSYYGAGAVLAPSAAADGTCEFLVYMAPGTYEAIAWAGSGFEARATLTFVPGDDSPVQLDLVRH